MTGIDIHHTIGPGIQNNGSNCTITESKIHETGMVEWQRWGNVGVILMGAYNTLRDSEIYNTGYNSTYGPGVVFETWGTYREGGVDTSHDNIVENCVIYNSPNFYGIVFYGSDNCIARRNIIYNMKGGIRIQKGGDAGEMTKEQKVTNNSKIFNNSIIECSEFGIKITDNCLDTEFYNNIFYQVGTPLNFYESVKNSIESSHNNFYSDGEFRIVYGDTTYTSLTDYSQATGKEQNSLYADPLFNNPTNSDFYLKSNSPCINAGIDAGLSYEGSAPDIGAYEYTLLNTTPPIFSNPSPSGTLPTGTTQTTISLTTNESATCKYSTTPNIPYASMTNTFSTTGGTSHSQTITGLSDGNTYDYYVRCLDEAGNPNTTDYAITFSVESGGGEVSDTTPPTGSISINNGDTTTNSQNINLSISASDSSGVAEMKISNTNDFGSAVAETYSTVKSWALSAGDGLKTVYAWFKDTIGNWNTAPYSDTITLDTSGDDGGGGGGGEGGTVSDTNPPVILNIEILDITANSVQINFNTNENTTSYIEYGLTVSYGSQTETNPTPISNI